VLMRALMGRACTRPWARRTSDTSGLERFYFRRDGIRVGVGVAS